MIPEKRPHLQDRPDDWETASDVEIMEALLHREGFIDPRWFNWVERTRPDLLRRSILLHAEMGGYVGAPARRWLAGKRNWRFGR